MTPRDARMVPPVMFPASMARSVMPMAGSFPAEKRAAATPRAMER